MSSALLGAAFGTVAGVGLATAVLRLPALRRPTLEDRLGPYLRDAPRPSRLLATSGPLTPFPTLERLLAPVLADGVRLLDRLLGGAGSVRRRLAQAGRAGTVEEFRAEQLLWGVAGFLVAMTLGLLALASGTVRSPVPLLLLCLLAATAGMLGRDSWLSSQVRRREQRMLAEFPTIAELLALAVTAGESPLGSMERVARLSGGELAGELRRALAEVRAGASLASALQDLAIRTSLPALARFADGVAIAVERGTPLAEVLRAQAGDAREAGKRALLEAGGRKEIAMMVPVVFLVLPVTVLFALFPGFLGLQVSS